MILQMLMDIITEIVKFILTNVTTIFPQIDLGSYMIEFTYKIISVCTQANNFMHFIVGDFVTVLVPMTLTLMLYKYTIYPIVTFVRSIFVNGNN